MNKDEVRNKMKFFWSSASITSRNSTYGTDLWRRYNPAIIYPIENAKNNYFLHTKHQHSHERMIYDNAMILFTKLTNGDEDKNNLKVKGFNYHFCMLDWAYENSFILGRPNMPSLLGTLGNISKIIKMIKQSSEIRDEVNYIYSSIVYPILIASGADLYFNIEKEKTNRLEILKIKHLGLDNISMLKDSINELSNNIRRLL